MVLIENYNGEYDIFKLTWSKEAACNYSKNGENVILVQNHLIRMMPVSKTYPIGEDKEQFLENLGEGACLEISSSGKVINTISRDGDNTLYITDKCNSNCIMCPMGEYVRKNGKSIETETLRRVVEYMPCNIEHLTITGGEPFYIRDGIFDILMDLKVASKVKSYLFLTNGRILSNKEYAERFEEAVPDNLMVGIPIHGSTDMIHDSISQTRGSFRQTIAGIINVLAMKNVKLEIRIVVNRMNINDLTNIARMISEKMKGIQCVRFMGMEMLGNAVVNAEKVWIPYEKVFDRMKTAIDYLVRSGIDVSIYNYPLCFIDKSYWGLCENSISAYKIRYSAKCDECRERQACGGIFLGTDKYIKESVRPVN